MDHEETARVATSDDGAPVGEWGARACADSVERCAVLPAVAAPVTRPPSLTDGPEREAGAMGACVSSSSARSRMSTGRATSGRDDDAAKEGLEVGEREVGEREDCDREVGSPPSLRPSSCE